MNRKSLNRLIIFFQWVLGLFLSIYLIVPIYQDQDSEFKGSTIYSPYEDWKYSPLSSVTIKNGSLYGTDPDSIISISPFLGQKDILIMDSLKAEHFTPFLLGHSRQDLQFLIKKSELSDQLISNSSDEVENTILDPIVGVRMQLIQSEMDISQLDNSLNKGLTKVILASTNDSTFAYNLLNAESGSPSECMQALKEGKNLLAFSKEDIYKADVEKIPVIRKIDWKNGRLSLDLSELGKISIISSGFTLDTLTRNLNLKISNVSWFRFEVYFEKEGLSYYSNPFFKYNEAPFTISFPKANNQLTIFFNLSWLLGIVILNLLITRLRNKYL